MQIKKKMYTTVIITVLAISMILTAIPAAFAISITVPLPMGDTGSPGQMRMVSGTADTTGGLIEVYWDEVHAWTGTKGLIGQGYASGTIFTVVFFVPEVPYGPHDLICLDVEEDDSDAVTFNVIPAINIDPDVGLAGDTITVVGKGFHGNEYITMYYWDGSAYQTLTTSPLMPLCNNLGSFTCTFVIPADAANLADNIVAEDESLATGPATLDVGPYITVTPDEGLAGSSVTVDGRGFTSNGLVDIEWLIGGSYIIVSADVSISAAGLFTTTFSVPSLPPPTAPGDDYTIRATDSGSPAVVELTTFTLVEEATITLLPPAGKVTTSVQVTGTWFTPNKLVTVTFDGTSVGTTLSNSATGAWTVTFLVPEVATGPYTVTGTDARGVTDSATFMVVIDMLTVQTRATEYYQGDLLSLYTWSNVPLLYDIEWEITDTSGNIYIYGYIDTYDWDMIGPANYMVPYYRIRTSTFWNNMLPDDALTGTWNFTAYNYGTGAIVDTNLFTVSAKPDMQDVIDEIDECCANMSDLLDDLESTITGVVTNSKGELTALINTKAGPITTKLDAVGPKLQAIEDTAVIIATMLGEVQVDLAALDLTAMGVDITAIKGDVATIKTNIGTVTTNVATLDAKVTVLAGDVATVSTTLGTLEGTVTAIDGKVATVDTSVGTIKADVSDILAKPDVDMTPVWIAVVLSLIAAIAAIFAVVTIRQKIAG
jgi:hypothetical protein